MINFHKTTHLRYTSIQFVRVRECECRRRGCAIQFLSWNTITVPYAAFYATDFDKNSKNITYQLYFDTTVIYTSYNYENGLHVITAD